MIEIFFPSSWTRSRASAWLYFHPDVWVPGRGRYSWFNLPNDTMDHAIIADLCLCFQVDVEDYPSCLD